VDADHAPVLLRVPERDQVAEVEIEEVVPRHDQQVIARESRALDDEADIADRAQSILVRAGSVVLHEHRQRTLSLHRPPVKVAGEARVGDDMELVDLLDGGDLVVEIVEHRPAGEGQKRLCDAVGERLQPGGIPGGEDDGLHGLGLTCLRSRRPGSSPALRSAGRS
jgi:hypothetical protein